MFRHQLLGLLRDGNAYHGYALVKEYVRRIGSDTNTGYAYRDLQKLVDEGLVEVVANENGADRRRRPYRITDAGRESFDSWFATTPRLQPSADGELAARAIFFEEVDPNRVSAVLESFQMEVGMLRQQILRDLASTRPGTQGGSALSAILRRRERIAAAEMAFLEELRTSITGSDASARVTP